MTRERLSTSTKVWFVALVAAFLAVAGVGLAQGHVSGQMMQPVNSPLSHQTQCPWMGGRHDRTDWQQHRRSMHQWQPKLLDGRAWRQLSPAQRWELMDRMHDCAARHWGPGDWMMGN
jgi:hypothetical protein